MATELHNTGQEVRAASPSTVDGEGNSRTSLRKFLDARPSGRFIVGCVQWAVVCGLIGSGYLGAAAIASGVRHASSGNDGQPILAASAVER